MCDLWRLIETFVYASLTTNHENIASRVFTTLSSVDFEEIALVQQCACLFLEERLNMEGEEGLTLTGIILTVAESRVNRLIKTKCLV